MDVQNTAVNTAVASDHQSGNMSATTNSFRNGKNMIRLQDVKYDQKSMETGETANSRNMQSQNQVKNMISNHSKTINTDYDNRQQEIASTYRAPTQNGVQLTH